MASFTSSLNPSVVSESGLSDPLNTSAFNTVTYATTGDLTSGKDVGDWVEARGRTFLVVNHTANTKNRTKPSWIWDHGRELRLLANVTPRIDASEGFSSI